MMDGVLSERFPYLAAVHRFVARDGRVPLPRRRDTGDEDGNNSVPAAPIAGGETAMLATTRYARGELGIAIDRGELRVARATLRRSNDERIDFFIEAASRRGEPVDRESDQYDEPRWVDPAPPTKSIPAIRRALDKWRRGVWFDRFGW